jgi:hypothetical protein
MCAQGKPCDPNIASPPNLAVSPGDFSAAQRRASHSAILVSAGVIGPIQAVDRFKLRQATCCSRRTRSTGIR